VGQKPGLGQQVGNGVAKNVERLMSPRPRRIDAPNIDELHQLASAFI